MSNSRSACLAIQRASSEEQVIAAVRHYLGTLSAEEAALMPAGLTALGRSHAENLVQTALQMVNHEMRSALDAPELELIREAVVVLATATTRLASLAAFDTLEPVEGHQPRLQ